MGRIGGDYTFAQATNNAQGRMDEPGGTPSDATMAAQNPDEYAWQLFFFLNRQAKQGSAGEADPSKTSVRNYDDDRSVVWETWGLASGLDIDFSSQPPKILVNKSEVFKIPATSPVAWNQLDRSGTQPKILSPNLKSLAVALAGTPTMGAMGTMGFHILIAPEGTSPAQDETRMNRSTYETVRSKHLYSVEGIQAAIDAAQKAGKTSLVEFDPASKEIKARWIHLANCDADANCADRKRYHWRSVVVDGQKQIWGLASLHIITKDLPNWFWADFSHIDCEKKVGACANDSEGAQTPVIDSTVPSGGTRAEVAGTKWAFYVLRGTETDFNAPNGVKRILSNPVIESGFQKSSCMTCHSYASAALASGTNLTQES
jgi:hypothetical protein